MLDYKNQYLKYKKKYLQIKNKKYIGGINNNSSTHLHYKFIDPKFSKILPDLNNTFLTYFVRDYSNHQADDVSDHSIWTALVLADWIQSKNNWISEIDTKYHDILIFSAFIHDIGKTGDGDYTSLISSYKPTHHSDGVDIILGKKKYITYNNDFDAALNSNPENIFYNDKRKIEKPTQNAIHNISEYSTNVETMLKIAGFTIEELVICAMIVGMVDIFEELVIEPIEKFKINNSNNQNENSYNTLFISYKDYFNELFNTINEHHKNSPEISSIDKNSLIRMCLAVSAANVKGAGIIQGKLDNLPEPITIYPTNDTHINSSNLKLFLNNIENKFSKYDMYYPYVNKILSENNTKNNQKINKKNKYPKKTKVQNNTFCNIQ